MYVDWLYICQSVNTNLDMETNTEERGGVMTKQEELAMALQIAATAFCGIYDKGGEPYFLHCLAVMEGVRHLGHEAMTVAVLHDLLEDCKGWSASHLMDEGFSNSVITSIVILTRREGEDYLTYIGRTSTTRITREIKKSDLRHNMNPARLIDLSDKSMERMKKYHTAYQFLLGVKDE